MRSWNVDFRRHHGTGNCWNVCKDWPSVSFLPAKAQLVQRTRHLNRGAVILCRHVGSLFRGSLWEIGPHWRRWKTSLSSFLKRQPRRKDWIIQVEQRKLQKSLVFSGDFFWQENPARRLKSKVNSSCHSAADQQRVRVLAIIPLWCMWIPQHVPKEGQPGSKALMEERTPGSYKNAPDCFCEHAFSVLWLPHALLTIPVM